MSLAIIRIEDIKGRKFWIARITNDPDADEFLEAFTDFWEAERFIQLQKEDSPERKWEIIKVHEYLK